MSFRCFTLNCNLSFLIEVGNRLLFNNKPFQNSSKDTNVYSSLQPVRERRLPQFFLFFIDSDIVIFFFIATHFRRTILFLFFRFLFSILLFISADRYMPRATVTDFDENLKYNPTADTYAAVYFEATSPDPDRYCCDSVWEVEGETINLLAKDAAAASPMLINLGLTRANAVYRLKLTVTDGIGSTSSSVVSLTTNGPPTSGTMAVTPYRGTALQTEFEFLLDAWSDDPDDYPLTYT